ncbi:MAG TPA: hypothetical protein DD435_04515 [Cyanobacteria bacterium UBA8530]|nr:hypothetical protein [Cyanobacteria bacterium UBA8530]
MLFGAFSAGGNTVQVIEEILSQLGDCNPKALVFFAAHSLDGALISHAFRERYAGAEVIGCTTAGEFNEKNGGIGGLTVLALPEDKVKRCVAGLAQFGEGRVTAVHGVVNAIAEKLRIDLRKADPARYVGIVLIDGMHAEEERVNDMLGNMAPLLSFAGGSAGDNLEFKETRVFQNGAASSHGAVFLLLDMNVPFRIIKTCSFKPLGESFTVTRANLSHRRVFELDGDLAVRVYADALGKAIDQLDNKDFAAHPLGLMIDGKPWIRSLKGFSPEGGIDFYCQISEGMEVFVMEATDIIAETAEAIESAKRQLDGASGGLMFNCIFRRLDLEAKGLMQEHLDCFEGLSIAGFHTYGESWMGHMNHTLTGIIF